MKNANKNNTNKKAVKPDVKQAAAIATPTVKPDAEVIVPPADDADVVIDQVNVLQGMDNEDEADKVSDEDLEIISKYAKAYPEEKVFHLTTDGQVFLNKNKADAIAHQKFLTKSETVKSLEVQ
jgi:hypothetical protein